MSGNDAPLYKAPGILGPYELLGPWKDEKGEPWKVTFNGTTANGAFDVDIFVDDDNKPYLYFPGRSTAGIYVAPLDPKELTHLTAAPKHLFASTPSHVWERWGENNEYTGIAWIEGPWMFKRNGTYYIEYSASGTQWLSYASGIYSAKSPLGPFTYSPRNPLLRKTSRDRHGSRPRLRGAGTGWELVGVLYDRDGESARRPADRHGPYRVRRQRKSVTSRVRAKRRNGRRVWWPIRRATATRARSRSASISCAPCIRRAHSPANVPATKRRTRSTTRTGRCGSRPRMTRSRRSRIDLVAADRVRDRPVVHGRFRPNRVRGRPGRRIWSARRRASAGAAAAPAPGERHGVPLQGRSFARTAKQYATVLDKTKNDVTLYTEFDEIPPTSCRFVRLTITDWPRTRNNAARDHGVHGVRKGRVDADALGGGRSIFTETERSRL